MSNDIKPTLDQHRNETKREIQSLKEDLKRNISDTVKAEMSRATDQLEKMKREMIQAIKDASPQK